MPGQHAVLSASSSKRWLSCPPSARLEEKLRGIFGEDSSPYAQEGTQAHALAELKLRRENGELDERRFQELRGALGEIPKEMDRATDDYADVVLSKLYEARQVCPDARLFIEQRLDFSHWVPEGFGTGDAVIVSDEVLEVCDLKYGKGVRVSAIENPQARLYGLGALAEFGALYDCSSVRDTIIQPRVLDSPVTEETLSREELLLWGGQVQPIAQQAWRGEGEYNPGDWCRFCAARALCAARAAQALRPLTHGFDAPGLIPDEDIPGILAVADTTEAWLRDIRAYAKSQAMRGQQWRGYKLVRGRRGNRAWKADAPVAEALSQAGYREEQYMVSRVKTPGEMEKELGKQAFDDLVGRFVTQAEGALNLAPDSDAREAVSPADADFSDLAT